LLISELKLEIENKRELSLNNLKYKGNRKGLIYFKQIEAW